MFRLFFIFFVITFLFVPSKVFAHAEVTVIEMTPEGFSPAEFTVDENSSVIFVNKDTESRWPASNIHPTHELYPAFDPRVAIAPGKSWAFKPTQVGEWKFHDHIFAHMRGVVTVISEEGQGQEGKGTTEIVKPESKQTFLSTLGGKVKAAVGSVVGFVSSFLPHKQEKISTKLLPTKEKFIKLSYTAQAKELEEVAALNGASRAWNYVKDVFAGEGGASGNIHDLAHLSGLLLYQEKGFNGIKDCSSNFAFGCYHGFLDKAFSKDLSRLLDAQNTCLKLNTSSNQNSVTGPVASCIHGIGHGVASFYSTTNLKKSLVSCRKLTVGSEYCFDGVFMEFVRSAPLSFFKKEDPLYPCSQLEKEFGYAYSDACGRNQPSLLMGRFKMSFEQVVGICLSSESKPFKEACFDSLGFSVASSGDPAQIIAGCQQMGEAQYTNRCLKAAAGELVFQEVPGWFEKSQEVCLVSEESSSCLENRDRLMRDYNKQVPINFSPKREGEDTNVYIRNQLEKCFGTGGRDGCYKQAADILYSQFGLKQSLVLLKENENYQEVYARCHEVTHYLSRLEYDKQKNIAKVYAQCDSTCHGGCYHGTLEAYLKEKEDVSGEKISSYFASACGKAGDYTKPIEYNECFHGLGHAAMFVTDMELRQSLKLCDTIAEQKMRDRCYTGVFMENSSSSTSFDHKSLYIKADDPFYPCNILEEKYLALCWQYQSSYFSIISGQDWEKVAALCLQVPVKYQEQCFRTIGTNQVGFTPSLEVMKHDCDRMPSEHFKNVCVAGVVSSLSYRFVGDMQKMIDFCSLVDRQNKESCYKQVGNGLLDWDKNEDVAKNYCQKIPDTEGQSWCLSVI